MRKYSRLCRDIYTLRRVNIYFHQVEFLLYPIGVSISLFRTFLREPSD